MIARAVVLALFWLAVLSGATGAFAQSQPLSEAGYSRDQATVRELRIWNGRMAVQIVGRGWTELARADGKPIAATTKLLNTDIALQAITLPVEEHFVETMDVVDDTGHTFWTCPVAQATRRVLAARYRTGHDPHQLPPPDGDPHRHSASPAAG